MKKNKSNIRTGFAFLTKKQTIKKARMKAKAELRKEA